MGADLGRHEPCRPCIALCVACATESPSRDDRASGPTRHHRDRCRAPRVFQRTHWQARAALGNFLTVRRVWRWPDDLAGAGALAGIGVLKKTNIQQTSGWRRPVVENAPRALFRRAVRGDSSESAGVFLLIVGSPVRQPAPSATLHLQVACRLRGVPPCPTARCSPSCTP